MSSRAASHVAGSNTKWGDRLYEDVSRHHKPVQDQSTHSRRQRSPSRVHHPYTSNCGRRRWPPSPKVEEVKVEEEIPMRGKIGQDPMIIDVSYSTTSSDSGSTHSRDSDDPSGPETPPTSDSDNRDRRYVWKPEPDVPIPQTYDTTRTAKSTEKRSTADVAGRDRGRKMMPKLDTDMVSDKSTAGSPPPLERARSPYASGPQDRKLKADRFSGEYLLSPDMMSPRRTYAESPRSQSHYLPRPTDGHANEKMSRGSELPRPAKRPSLETHRANSHYIPRSIDTSDGRGAQGKDGRGASIRPQRPSLDRRALGEPHSNNSPITVMRPVKYGDNSVHSTRPLMDRRASDLPYPNSPSAAANQPKSGFPKVPCDDLDSDQARTRVKSGQVSPQSFPKVLTAAKKPGRHHERGFSAELPSSTCGRSHHSSNVSGPPVNLNSLVSGAAISQTLNAMLNGDHPAGRRASPRPSPGGSPLASPRTSPKASPYSSPPRTPPSEPVQHRANAIAGLKKDSPGSRPSSPLSSRSSTWTAEPDPAPHEKDQRIRYRPTTLVSRQTAPSATPVIQKSEPSELLSAPGISVRSPSPASCDKSNTSKQGQHDISRTRFGDEAPVRPPRPSNLRPTGSFGRQRSASTADVRPQLTIDPHASEMSSRGSRARDLSPNLASASDKHRFLDPEPSSPAARSRSSRPETVSSDIRSRSRSRSYVPEPTFANPGVSSSNLAPTPLASRSQSTFAGSTATSTGSRSSAPKPATQGFVPIPPAKLPKCPRPHLVAGYDDWYTLNQNSAFTICSSCRDHVFGVEHQGRVQPRLAAPESKMFCYLNNPWVRLALTLHGPDANLLSSLSTIISRERSCPKDQLAPRDWYRLENPENGKHIVGFNACPNCVHSVETLFPSWRNVFYKSTSSHHHELKERPCSLRTTNGRFGDYLNMFVESSLEAERVRKPPNTGPVCDLAKQMAAIDICPRDKMFARKAWHIHPHLPEFTICQECYEDAVYPLVKAGLPLAAKIDKKPHLFPNPEVPVCCHLYSSRMRKMFREACEDDDYAYLRHTVLKRHMLQQDMLATLRELDDHPGDREVGDRLRELLDKWKDKE